MITKQQARRFILAHQALWPPYELEGKVGILNFIGHVGCIQFDPLNIVGHNTELVLQSRITDFRSAMLQELLYEDRKLLDGWDKMMAIYRIEDWHYFYYRQREAASRSRRRDSELVKEVSIQILREIEERGPLSSIDLDHDQKVAWSWGPKRLANVALDNMLYLGEVVIHHKINTRKVYDLACRHIPEELLSAPDPHQTKEQYHDWHVLRRIGSIGLLWNRGSTWPGIYGARSKERAAALKRLIKQGKVAEIYVEDIKTPLYMRTSDTQRLEKVSESIGVMPHAAILAPLDNLLWDRQLIKELFDFEYTWEVYKPIPERLYGYYVLPVLYSDRFIARFEPGMNKESGALVIKNWWWESGITSSEEMQIALRDCFERFLGYLGADEIEADGTLVQQEGLKWLPFIVKE